MNLLQDNDRPEIEDGVRAMLHRLAADATVNPPHWDELTERPNAVVLPLGVSESIADARDQHLGRARRPRLSLAAAAVLVLAVGGALVVDRTGSDPAEAPAGETISAISPGDPSFDAGAAAAVWATGEADPVAAATSYLQAMGVPTSPSNPADVVLRTRDDATAVVDWTLSQVTDAAGTAGSAAGTAGSAAGSAGGTVYLRSTSIAGSPATWTVVGAAASDVALADVHYDGGQLSFTVARTSAATEQLAVSVWVDGQPVSLGGDAVAQAGNGTTSLGEMLELPAGADARDTLELPVEADDIVTLRVAHVVEGQVRSVTQMAVALPDADPAIAAAGGAPPAAADAGAEATGQADATAGGAAGTADAGAQGDAEGTGSVDTELPDGSLPTLPELPLPTIPDDHDAPAPSLPAPPTTAPGLPDLLP